MRFMVLVKASERSEAGELPSAELLGKMGAFNEELVRSGALLAADGLQPTSKGVRISFAGPRPVVTDGPFTETKELVAGYWILEMKSRDEVIAWISRAPFDAGEQVEIRQVYEAEDFAPIFAQTEPR